MTIEAPLTRGFLFSFEALNVLDESGKDIGIREINLKLTMEGKGTVDASSREDIGWIPGKPKWTVTMKWELTHWTAYMQRHPGYADEISTRIFDYLTRGRNYTVELVGLSFLDQDNTVTKGHDGALEMSTSWGLLTCKQSVDGVEIPYLQDVQR